GFCMWDTKQTDYNIMNTPYHKDVLAMLAEACHRRDIRLGLYYSCPDWHHPNSLNFGHHHQLPQPNPDDQPDLLKYIDFVQQQVVELCSNYGTISEFFWDIPQEMNFPQLNETIRRLQPECLINDRGYGPGDYSTPEREIPVGKGFTRPTEACDSVGRCSWGYRANEDYFAPVAVMRKIDMILSRGGNFLLNVGPKPDGTIPDEAKDILRKVGMWFKAVRESYDAEPFAFDEPAGNMTFTRKADGTLYVHFPEGLMTSGFELPCDQNPKAVTLLNNGQTLPAKVEVMPSHALQGRMDLHVFGLDTEKLSGAVPVIKVEW
ncbi:MAG: alpha-L-fucosidase, partial [Victivallales bacterium]|nr:alpha-L-fucosidase [Victivallales bacterium]